MENKEQQNMNKTQTLLETAIKGGKNGRRAMLHLRCQYRPLFINIYYAHIGYSLQETK